MKALTNDQLMTKEQQIILSLWERFAVSRYYDRVWDNDELEAAYNYLVENGIIQENGSTIDLEGGA